MYIICMNKFAHSKEDIDKYHIVYRSLDMLI